MKVRSVPVWSLVVVCLFGSAESVTAQCEPDGDIQFVCGPVSPEDLVAVPDTPWVIVAGIEDDGYLYATSTQDHRSSVLFPTPTIQSQPDALFRDCPGPATERFTPHGLSLRPGDGGMHTVYVVRHGAREAIEVFELDAGGADPSVTWVGCVVAPDGVTFNSVAALPDGGFAATHFNRPVGQIWEWQPETAWTEVPGSETNGPNGLVSSPDGRWLYIGGWGTQSLIRLSRGQTTVQVDSVRWGSTSITFTGHRMARCLRPATSGAHRSRSSSVSASGDAMG